MKKLFEQIAKFFTDNGIIKILISFVLLIVAVLVVRKTMNHTIENIFTWIGYIAGGYIILTILIFLIVGIVNTIKDISNKS